MRPLTYKGLLIRRLLDEGHSTPEIVKRLGVDRSHVAYHAKQPRNARLTAEEVLQIWTPPKPRWTAEELFEVWLTTRTERSDT